ncbi:hypothetical protein GCM10007859_07060 [Brevundimonas denitrificans]|uniref:DUF1579 domain-containing protein n=1 Tax=Brevundimonas denitrificans TaxID=1443434 RepID=A0ABQ6BFH1_9CAUL|nr:DUF1579 domain-containing protein [Brevundimonas denitrificans]GLS00698.1 hypothetical protein GCM10007859_07060 [Brevundimonas denitrificans]
MKPFACLALAAVLLAAPAAVQAQAPASPNGTEAQRAAMHRLDMLDGEWRGEAIIHGPDGTTTLTQTERVGSMLGGSIKVIEGRGYAADGSTRFNAMATVSWDARAGRYGFRSYAQGFSGDYPFEVTGDGFRWETPAGPGAKIEYVAVVRDGTWHEVGTWVAEGQPPRRMIEMRLTRIGDTDWPAGGAVDPAP